MNRSSKTGRAVDTNFAKANPDTTVKEGKSKDTLRLDWLTNYRPSIWWSGWNWLVQLEEGAPIHVHTTPRGAIDRAMKGK